MKKLLFLCIYILTISIGHTTPFKQFEGQYELSYPGAFEVVKTWGNLECDLYNLDRGVSRVSVRSQSDTAYVTINGLSLKLTSKYERTNTTLTSKEFKRIDAATVTHESLFKSSPGVSRYVKKAVKIKLIQRSSQIVSLIVREEIVPYSKVYKNMDKGECTYYVKLKKI
jgi:hypothetical protein